MSTWEERMAARTEHRMAGPESPLSRALREVGKSGDDTAARHLLVGITNDPRAFGLTGADLHDVADLLYAPDDSRMPDINWDHATNVRFGSIRSRLRSLADAIGAAP